MSFPFHPVTAETSTEAAILTIVSYDESTDTFACLINEEHEQTLCGLLVYTLTGGGEPSELVGKAFAHEFDNVV